MHILEILTISFLVPLVSQGVIKLLSKEYETPADVHMPKFFKICGICGGAICSLAVILSFFFALSPLLWAIFASIALFSLLSICAYKSIQIRYDETYIYVKGLFCKKTYSYCDIKGVITGASEGYTLVFKSGKLRIDSLAVGRQEFLSYAEERFSDCDGCFAIPDIKNRLFNGNVIEPGPMVFFLCLPGVILLVFAVWMSIEMIFIKIPEDLTESKIIVSQIEEQDSITYIYAADDRYYIFSEGLINTDALQKALSENNTLYVSYLPNKQREGGPNSIWYMSSENGNIFATNQTVYDAEIKNAVKPFILWWVITIAWWLFVLVCFYILAHADKYPRMAALIVKKEYRNF